MVPGFDAQECCVHVGRYTVVLCAYAMFAAKPVVSQPRRKYIEDVAGIQAAKGVLTQVLAEVHGNDAGGSFIMQTAWPDGDGYLWQLLRIEWSDQNVATTN